MQPNGELDPVAANLLLSAQGIGDWHDQLSSYGRGREPAPSLQPRSGSERGSRLNEIPRCSFSSSLKFDATICT